ncbi:MAG: hypothetical protein IJS15_02010 [Victivallales bacterium]|nr:hypothetical protein [Victivallales bacterium]
MGYFEEKWAYYSRMRAHDDTSVSLNFTAAEDGCTVALNKIGGPAAISLEYSLDNQTWQTYNVDTEISLARRGDKVFFKGDNTVFSSSSSNLYKFVLTGKLRANGNIMSLVDSSCMSKAIPNHEYFFNNLFRGCDSLLTAPLLPARTLRNRCYASMFHGCSSLLAMPILPSGSSSTYAYQRMFKDCTSLVGVCPLLCENPSYGGLYYEMFSGCTSLKESPVVRVRNQVSSLSNTFTNMFEGCSSLAKVTVNFTEWKNTSDWLSGVASEGVFVCPSELDTTTRSASRVPAGWTVVNV